MKLRYIRFLGRIGLVGVTVLIIGSADKVSAQPSLGTALNATNLTWATSGDGNWFGQTNTSQDGVAAAQSPSISGAQSAVLQTTVTGPGTLAFWWQCVAYSGDLDMEFDIDSNYVASIGDFQTWTHEYNISIPAGVHTLTWNAHGLGSADSNDVAWVDEVSFTTNIITNTPVTANVVLTIFQNTSPGGQLRYTVAPTLNTTPGPVTTNRVKSPNGQMFSYVDAANPYEINSTDEDFSTLSDAVNACTNGQWTVYLNEGDPSEQVFCFNVAINGLTTNYLAPAYVLAPVYAAVNVPTNYAFQWTGPTSATSLEVAAFQVNGGSYYNYASLPVTATNWPSQPGLVYGLMEFGATYFYGGYGDITFTTPVDTNNYPIYGWAPEINLCSQAAIAFTVGAPAPLPVQLNVAPPQGAGGNFQLSFQTLAGRTNIVQMETNLTGGAWMDVTNFVGDGSNWQLTVPKTNVPAEYFRVITR